MEHDLETLEQQTAPESTRGLFDAPEHNLVSRNNTDKRRSFHVYTAGSFVADDDGSTKRGGGGHQRSKSAITSDMMISNHNGGRRNTNFGLHTLAEEQDRKQQQQENPVTVDSLQDMINTLKSLPPYHQDGGSRRNSSHRKSSISGGGGKRLSYSGGGSSGRNSIDIQSVLPIPRTRAGSINQRQQQEEEDEEEGGYVSREAALAEAEAKLMGTFNNNRKQARRYSESSSTAGFDIHSLANNNNNKRMSLQQLPTLNESSVIPTTTVSSGRLSSTSSNNRRISFNKPLNLGNDSNKSLNRRSSRNLEYDWRQSVSTPRSSTYRNSFNLVPFTPTRVNFTRDDANPHQRRPLFIAHLPFSALTPLFRSRQLVRGLLRVNKRNRSDAYISCDNLDSDIYVCGSRDRNRALEGDVVAIRLVDVEKVLREKKEKEEAKLIRNGGQVKVRLPDEEDENEIIFGGDDDVDVVKPKYCGVVVAILERAQNQVFSGTLTLMRPNNKRAQEEKAAEEAQKAETGQVPKKEAPRIVWFKATDKRVPLIAIPIEQAPPDFVENSEQYAKRLFVGSIKRWPITSLHPFGTLERELGHIEDLEIQTKAILADNNVTETEFSEAVVKCLPSIPYAIQAEDLEGRRDFRDSRVFTLAPANAQVLDNAISIQKLGDDTYEVGVHVSDVTHFIKPHSPMDKEARARAARVELVHRSVPILPTELTEKVTNLVPNEPRLAFSVVWKLSSVGKILDTWFGKSVIQSCARVSFEGAQRAIEGEAMENIADNGTRTGIEQDIRMLYAIATKLHEVRFAEGAMSQMRDELAFEFDDAGDPTSISIRTKKPSVVIVKEFHRLANQCVAQKISSQFPEQAMLRRHGPPNERKIRELKEYVTKYLGVPMDISSAGAIERSIESIQDPVLKKMVSVIVLKTLQPPKYFCTGTLDIIKYAHYALNVPLYTHFTSPSRRFADIIVHRQLEMALTGEKRFYLDRDTVQKLAQHCNIKKEAASYAREQSQLLFLAVYLSKRGQKQQSDTDIITVVRKEATVVAAFDQYFDVMIPELNLEKRIHLANLPVWRSTFDEQERALTMYWKKGVDTTTGKQRPWSLSDDEEDDDMDEEALLEEMRGSSPPLDRQEKQQQQQQQSVSQSILPKKEQKEEEPQKNEPSEIPAPSGPSKSTSRRPEASRSTGKRASMVHARLSDSTAYSTDQASQTIKALDKIQVLVTVEMVKTPPLIRILAANPFA